jgi:Ca2+-binding RTX toxin-like protein
VAVIVGTSGRDTLNGSPSADSLSGLDGDDSLIGGDGDDSFSGGLGNDTLNGGSGTDTALYSGPMAGYRFSHNSKNQLIITDVDLSNGNEGTDILETVEMIQFTDGAVTFRPSTTTYSPKTYIDQAQSDRNSPTLLGMMEKGYAIVFNDGGARLKAQRYDSSGTELGQEITLYDATSHGAIQSSIARLKNGDIIVTWQGFGGNTEGGDIFKKRFNSHWESIDKETPVNTTKDWIQRFPSVATLEHGGYIIAWASQQQDRSGYGIYAQQYSQDDVPLGQEFRVNTWTLSDQSRPKVLALASGGFVVAWHSLGQDGDGWGVYLKRFDSFGNELSSDHPVNSTTKGDQQFHAITALSDGGWVVAWTSVGQDGFEGGIYAQRFNADGSRYGGEFQVNSTTRFNEVTPQVLGRPDGGFVVAWISNRTTPEVHLQKLDATGSKIDEEITITTSPDEYALSGSLALANSADGSLVVAWVSELYLAQTRTTVAYSKVFPSGKSLALRGDDNSNHLQWVHSTSIFLEGKNGEDTLIGSDGSDGLDGGSGSDNLIGGSGNDIYYADTQADVVFENSGEGIDTVISTSSFYLYANVENLALSGSAYFGVGNELDNALTGNDIENLLIAGAGNDVLRGGGARDALFGEAGNDQLYADAGVDYIVAGLGNDTVYGGADADEIYGQEGNDLIYGGDDFATDILVAGEGNDTIDGGPAWDLMYGGTGDDTFYVSQQVDWVFEQPGEGTDSVIADSPNGYYLFANVENLTLVGTTPFGVGNELANLIIGNASANTLLAGAGNDTLDGGAGTDILWGQEGADVFRIGKGTGTDIVADFQASTDKLDLSAWGFTSLAQVQARMRQVGSDLAIDLDDGNRVILIGVNGQAITATDVVLGPGG